MQQSTQRDHSRAPVVAGLVFGLVNVIGVVFGFLYTLGQTQSELRLVSEQLSGKFKELSGKFKELEIRVEKRLDKFELRIDRFEERLIDIQSQLKYHDKRLGDLEKKR